MVDIRYMDSQSNEPLCFDLVFALKDYIPHKYFEISDNGAGAELYYLIDLLKNNNFFEAKKTNCHQLIWSYHYDCHYQDIPFSMVYDEDYDIVSFAVDNLSHRTIIAETLRYLVEAQKLK